MEITAFDKEKNTNLRQSNFLIEARYKLTLHEFRIITVIMSMISQNDEDFKEYRIDLVEVKKILQDIKIQSREDKKETKNESIISELKKATKGLLTKPLIIINESQTLQANWISSAKYQKGKSYVVIKLDPELKPYLIKIRSNYTDFELQELLSLKSFYSAKIYELMKQFFPNIPKRKFAIGELQQILGCNYPNYGNFKDRVLKSAILEINNKTRLSIDFEEKKEGRKISELIFNIRGKSEPIKKILDNNIDKKNEDLKIPSKVIKIPPSDEELKAFWKKNKFRSIWEEFRDYYNSNGWKVGKATMKNWESAARNWERRDKEYHPDRHKIETTLGIKIENKESKEISEIRGKIKFHLGQIDQGAAIQYFNLSNIEKHKDGFKIKAIHPKAENFRQQLQEINVFLE